MPKTKRTFTDEQLKHIETLSGYGLNQQQVADFLKIPKRTFQRWIEESEIAQTAINVGRAKALANVAGKLYAACMSGDKASIFFYLKCRGGWKETQVLEHQGSDGGPIQSQQVFSPEQLHAMAHEVLKHPPSKK